MVFGVVGAWQAQCGTEYRMPWLRDTWAKLCAHIAT